MMYYPLQNRLKPIIFGAEKMRRKHAKPILKRILKQALDDYHSIFRRSLSQK